MRVILIGPAEDRARLRASLNGSLRVVGEFATMAAAEASGLEADGILVAPRSRLAGGDPRSGSPSQHWQSGRFAARPPRSGSPSQHWQSGRFAARPQRRREAPAYEEGEDESLAEALTPREIQVLELLAEGLPNKAIAARLQISDQTVKFHVASIYGKLGAANRTDAVRRAVRRGFIAL